MPDRNSSPLSDAQALRLIRMYGEAEKEILKECNRLLLKNPESYSLAWQKTVLQRVQQIRSDLLGGSRTWCSEAIPDNYMKGVAWADADPLAGNKLLAGFGSIHQQAVEVLADNAYSRLENVVHVIGRQTDDLFRSVALEQSKGSVIGYQTTKQTAKRIREDLAERGITGFVDKAGHSWDMRRYAKVLAQETTNQSFRQGTINRLQEKGHDLIRLSKHSGACPKCTPFEGRTFSLSGTDSEFPSIEEARAGGVFHVGCLHVISLAPEEKDRFIGKLQGKEGEAARQAEIDRLAKMGGWKPEEAPKAEKSISPSFDKLKSDRLLYDDITRQLKNMPAKDLRTPEHTKAIKELNDQLGNIMQNDSKLMRAAYNELIAAARKEFPKVTFALEDKGGFIDPHVINETLNSLRKVTKDYPGAMPKKIVSKDLGDKVFAQWDDELKILRHNSKLVSAQNRSPLTGIDQDRFERALKRNVENGYHPIGCDSIESVVTHELGHSLERTLDIRKLTEKIKEFNAAHQNVDDLSEYSKYGNSKGEYHERWAEAFASMYHTPPDKQSAFVKAFKQFLEENGATK